VLSCFIAILDPRVLVLISSGTSMSSHLAGLASSRRDTIPSAAPSYPRPTSPPCPSHSTLSRRPPIIHDAIPPPRHSSPGHNPHFDVPYRALADPAARPPLPPSKGLRPPPQTFRRVQRLEQDGQRRPAEVIAVWFASVRDLGKATT
jgi:hypothetical protein